MIYSHKCNRNWWCIDERCTADHKLCCEKCIIVFGHQCHTCRSTKVVLAKRKCELENIIRYMDQMLVMLKLCPDYHCDSDEHLLRRMKEKMQRTDLAAWTMAGSNFRIEFNTFMKRALGELEYRFKI